MWDLETQTQVGRTIDTTHPGFHSWSADGRFLSSYVEGGEAFGHIEIWNFDTDRWPELACDLVGRNLTEDEWAEFGPRTIERRATCP